MKAWFIFRIMEKGKVIRVYLGPMAFSIDAAAVVALVNLQAVKTTAYRKG